MQIKGTLVSNLKIKRAEVKDVSLILTFIKELATTVNQLNMVIASEEDLAKSLFGADQFVETYLAFIDEIPVGYMLFYKTFSTFKSRPGIYIEDLYVATEYRRRGIGRAMLEFVIEYATHNMFHKVEWYVNNKNTKAITFYDQIGAIRMDYKSIYYIKTY
jgi:ribosomal protein S18 acetylase RimI-like enzyme